MHFYTLLSGVSCVLLSFILRQQKNCITENVVSLCSVKVATPLAPLKRLFPVNLPSANGFNKPFTASKFELCVENNPPYDCNHTEDSLFYEHRPIDLLFNCAIKIFQFYLLWLFFWYNINITF